MSPLARLYLVACWSYIISFHITLAFLTRDWPSKATLRILEQQTLD